MASRTTTPHEEPSRRSEQRRASAWPLPDDPTPWRATGREVPIFLDERGRRGLLVRMLGVLGVLVSAGALTLVVIGALAFTRVSPARGGGSNVPPALVSHPQAPPRELPDLASHARAAKTKHERV